MPKIQFYHRYSDLDNRHEFGVVPDGCGSIYHAWVFFYLGAYLSKNPGFEITLYPYKVYSWERPVKEYKINGAKKCAELIVKRMIKILTTKP